jgi:23S rRNA A1618 N6-methylase RlmF
MGLNKIKEISPIVELLGEERVEKLKDGIMEIILEQVRDDLEHWDSYICYPPDFQDAFSEAYDEIRNKLKKMYKDKALEVATNAVNKFAEEALKRDT